mgnify:CR=1 FL=1
MSKVLLREFFELKCDDRGCKDLLTEGEKRLVSEGFCVFPAKLQQCDVQNGNGRVYGRNLLEREIQNYAKLVEEGRAIGECDHPDDSVINLKNASHKVIRIWWDGDDVVGTIQCLKTPSGEILKGLYDSGVKFGFSSRALGSLRPDPGSGAQIVQEDLQLICFDAVSEPSAPNAYILNQPAGAININENEEKKLTKIFTKGDRINRALNEIF